MVYDSCPGVRDMADGSRTRSRRVLILTCVHCDGTANRLVESAYASAFLRMSTREGSLRRSSRGGVKLASVNCGEPGLPTPSSTSHDQQLGLFAKRYVTREE
jgi:hypothetical protein